MAIEPTIMHAAGAGIERTHDAAVIFLDHQGARIRFLDGAELSAVSAAHLDLTELHDTFRVHDKSFTGGFGLNASTVVTPWVNEATIKKAVEAGHDVVVYAGYYLE